MSENNKIFLTKDEQEFLVEEFRSKLHQQVDDLTESNHRLILKSLQRSYANGARNKKGETEVVIKFATKVKTLNGKTISLATSLEWDEKKKFDDQSDIETISIDSSQPDMFRDKPQEDNNDDDVIETHALPEGEVAKQLPMPEAQSVVLGDGKDALTLVVEEVDANDIDKKIEHLASLEWVEDDSWYNQESLSEYQIFDDEEYKVLEEIGSGNEYPFRVLSRPKSIIENTEVKEDVE